MAKFWLAFLILGYILTTFAEANVCSTCGQSDDSGQSGGSGGTGGSGGQPGGSDNGAGTDENCGAELMCHTGLCVNQRYGAVLKDPNSSGYIVCQCDCEILMPCPDDLVFNISNYRCDWAPGTSGPSGSDGNGGSGGSGNCGGSCGCSGDCGSSGNGSGSGSGSDSGNENLNVVCDNDVTLCQNQRDSTLFAMDGVCNQFYKCAYGCAVPQYCPANLVYDPRYQLCNYPWSYTCPWPYTAPSGPGVGPPGSNCAANNRCVGIVNGIIYPSTTSCSKFDVCDTECVVEMSCPDGLEYNSSLQTCTYPSESGCSL